METLIKSRSLEPDVCRCCLAASGTWDLAESYTTDAGIKEVFIDMLQECYGITLSRLSEWGCSKLACELCVKLLRESFAFRKQVLEAERQFLEDWKGVGNLSVKIEDDNLQPNAFEDSPNFNHDENTNQQQLHHNLSDSDNLVLSQRRSPRTRQGRKARINANIKRKEITRHDCDSDTPIAQWSNKNSLSYQEHMNENEIVTNTLGDFDEKVNENNFVCVKGQNSQNDIKHVSERKRVILTCDIVLKETTACPFRHHKSWFQCFFCSQDFMEINLLRNHTLQSHSNIDEQLKNIKRYPRSLQIDISELKCRQCDLSLSDVESMTRHFESVHQKVIYKECIADYKVNASPYTCHLCKREFHVFRTLTTHLNEHYANCICDVCGKSFLNSKRLKVHKRTHENGTYPCNECGKVLKTKSSIANHMESAHSKRIVKCQICFKPMKHYNDRIKHMSEVHNITHTFKCTICSREYNIKHYLATHMRQTHGHKNKKCLECGMAFITNHGLKKHMQRHSGEKPYTCSVCSKSYVRSYTLREHMRIHESENQVLASK